MEFSFSKNKIVLERELSRLDEFVLDFASLLDDAGADYVIVSGYVAIVFGRSRGTEDVDILVRRLDKKRFSKFWKLAEKKFECINAANEQNAYDDYLANDTAIRFSRKGKFIPNIEFKYAKNELDEYSLENRVALLLNGKKLFISQLELQIAYKLFLGSEKDVEDARFLYKLFQDKLDLQSINSLAGQLNVKKKLRLLGLEK